ncbi:MAG TPA: Na(+)-translocating NADH-quinone reductase subunit A [Oligoflexia bacterium]|nr:Na(+)-translocating NADH-quinone reductase subunit A [Oligoflexia bacterium]HMR24205.1 Na(+)-translocating NADH-quinone reductase subunit A [Oligoflexia bacterium]
MKTIKISKGIKLPITGEVASNEIYDLSTHAKDFAILGPDYNGMKPTILTKVGETVKVGQVVFEDKKNPGVVFTSPVAGTIKSINRGEKRTFQSMVIEKNSEQSHVEFENYKNSFSNGDFTAQEIQNLMQESGLWTALRTRPYSKTPQINAKPKALFITAIDSNPLAPYPNKIIAKYQKDFDLGLKAISLLTPKVFLCVANQHVQYNNLPDNCEAFCFEGPHPSGLVGTHIHYLAPADKDHEVWHIGYQDLIALGKLLATGQSWTQRVISIAGSEVKVPKLALVTLGANILQTVEGSIKDISKTSLRSGSVFSGRNQDEIFNYLGRYHLQITALKDDTQRELLGWQGPGFDKFSVKNLFLSKMIPFIKFPFSNSTHGSPRAIVPTGAFESVFPLNILPVPLLKALCMHDIENAEQLGCIELDEEDLALCTFVCSGKKDYGPMLRNILTDLEKGL